jgi:hypothetical protein
VLAHHAGWWWYPGLGGRAYGEPIWYAAAGLAAAGAGLLGWRVQRRFGGPGLAVFLVACALYCGARDYRVAHAAGSVIAFGPGVLPWLADTTAAFALMALALAIQLGFGGDPRRLARGSAE